MTEDDLNRFLMEGCAPHWSLPGVRPRITCADGVSLFVQASCTHYCTPRSNAGPWDEVEVGFPSVKPPDSWREYSEDWDRPTYTIYQHIPVKLVVDFINAHGGRKQ